MNGKLLWDGSVGGSEVGEGRGNCSDACRSKSLCTKYLGMYVLPRTTIKQIPNLVVYLECPVPWRGILI